MERTFLVLLITAAFVLSAAAFGDLCSGSCATEHPQKHFCNSTLAMKILILNEDRSNNDDIPFTKKMTAEVLTNWKVGPRNGEEFVFYAPQSFCGAKLTIGKTYVITVKDKKKRTATGEKYWLHGSCDYYSLWDDLTEQQQDGFEGDYDDHCSRCPIQGVYSPLSLLVEDMAENDYSAAATYWTPTNCYYNPQKSKYYEQRSNNKVKDCEDSYGLCKYNRNTESCQWKLTAEYEKCFDDRDKFVMVDSGKFAITNESQCDVYTNKRKRWRCREEARRKQEETRRGSVLLI